MIKAEFEDLIVALLIGMIMLVGLYIIYDIYKPDPVYKSPAECMQECYKGKN